MLSNYELLAVAVACFAAAIWWMITRTTAAAPPVVLAFIMLTQGVGGQAWEWSKWSAGAGLPPFVAAAPFGESKAAPVFLFACIGASLSALLIRRTPQRYKHTSSWTPPRNLTISVIIVGLINFIGFLIGQGPNFFRRQVYLEGDGPDVVLRIFWPLGVLFGLTALALLLVEKDLKLRIGLIGVAALWYIGPVSVGSRTALAIPLAAGVLILYKEISQRRLHLPLLVGALGLLALTTFTFSVLLEARTMPHGLLNMPEVARVTYENSMSSTDSFLLPVKQLASSIFASVPNAEQSAIYGVDGNILIANANPLPGTGQPMELERYWPYEWVPLSFAGTWFGAFGAWAQMLLFGAVGLVSGYAARNIQCTRFPVLFVIPIGLAAVVGVLSIQYPSRMVWRIISTLVFFAIFTFLIRRSARLDDERLRREQKRKSVTPSVDRPIQEAPHEQLV